MTAFWERRERSLTTSVAKPRINNRGRLLEQFQGATGGTRPPLSINKEQPTMSGAYLFIRAQQVTQQFVDPVSTS